jgi:hypothetical protein
MQTKNRKRTKPTRKSFKSGNELCCDIYIYMHVYCIFPAIHDVFRNDFNPLMYFFLILFQLDSHYFRSDIQEELVSYIVEKVTCK